MITDPNRNYFIRGNTKICPVLEVKMTNNFDLHGIEIKNRFYAERRDSILDGCHQGVGRHVTVLSEENKKLLH